MFTPEKDGVPAVLTSWLIVELPVKVSVRSALDRDTNRFLSDVALLSPDWIIVENMVDALIRYSLFVKTSPPKIIPFGAFMSVAEVIDPAAVIDVGEIAPNASEIDGVVVGLATVPETPLAVATPTDVTVPVPPPPFGVYTNVSIDGSQI